MAGIRGIRDGGNGPFADSGRRISAGALERPPAVRPRRDRPISVCLPAFNGAPYIGDAIRSVLGQSFDDFELVVVDDGSSDGTADVVEAFRDERLRLVRNPTHLGLVGNWNRCLTLARGRHMVVFHQDDLMAPENLRAKLEFLEARPAVGLVHSNVVQIDVRGAILSDCWTVPPTPHDEGQHDGRSFFHSLVTGVNLVCAPSVMVPRVVFERLGGFDARLPFTADWEMWLRIALFYDVGYLTAPLVNYRRHDAMETMRTPQWQRLEQSYLAKMLPLEKYPDRVPDVDSLRRRIFREYLDRALTHARHEIQEGRPGQAAEYIRVMVAVCERTRRRPVPDEGESIVSELVAALGGPAFGWHEALEAKVQKAEARAEDALARAERLARTLEEKDRLIDGMVRTRAWRTAQKWWSMKHAVTQLLRRT